jgi:hypothetical protein
MAFKYRYASTSNPIRTSDATDLAPVRGVIGGAGTTPDFSDYKYQKARLVVRCVENQGGSPPVIVDVSDGTATFTIWYRDLVEITDAGALVLNPPTATKVLWVRDGTWTAATVDHTQEVILENVAHRGVYVQVTNMTGTSITGVEIYLAPYDRWHPMRGI